MKNRKTIENQIKTSEQELAALDTKKAAVKEESFAKTVIIYDYTDLGVPVFGKMYERCLSVYKAIGYDICA